MTARGIQAYKFVVPVGSDDVEPTLRTHEGYDWVFVLSGKLRLVLGEHDLILEPGEVAEFDTRTPHWFGANSSGGHGHHTATSERRSPRPETADGSLCGTSGRL